MKVIDRFLIKEFIKYAVLAVLCVVAIYLLIDLFDQLDYFIGRHASIFTVALYYLYNLPAAISLMLPVGIILSCFLVYGMLMRERSISVMQIAGINTYRLFSPIIILGLALIVVEFFGYEFVTIPSLKKLDDLRRIKIERKYGNISSKRYNLYIKGEQQLVYFIYEYESIKPVHEELSGIMRNFVIVQLNQSGRLEKRYDGSEARYINHQWLGKNINVRSFIEDTIESYVHYDSMVLVIDEKPSDFTEETRVVEEMSVWELSKYIEQLKIAGLKTAKSEVEFNCRFSYAFIGLILILLSLPLTIKLRRGSIMFGLGLGLLFAFIYWGLLQVTKAYGQSSVISPFLAAWFGNFLFLVVDAFLMIKVKQ